LFSFFQWNSVYKFHQKLIKTGLIKKLYLDYKNQYINEMNEDIKYLYTDTSFILNNNGTDKVNYNPQVKKHKTSKISIIIDNFDNPISIDAWEIKSLILSPTHCRGKIEDFSSTMHLILIFMIR